MSAVLTLRGKLKEATAKADQIMQAAERESRAMSDEERAEVEQHLAAARGLKDQIERAQGDGGFRRALADMGVRLEGGRVAGVADPDSPVVPAGGSLTAHLAAAGRCPVDAPEGSIGRLIAASALGDPRFQERLRPLERMALMESTDATGGFLVPEVLSSRFLDRVRNQAQVFNAGAQTVVMTAGNVALAKLAQPGADPGPQWHAELEPTAESALTFERVVLKAKTLPVRCVISIELQEDAENVEQVVEAEFAAALALALDKAALVGTGGTGPLGITGQPGVVTLPEQAAPAPANHDFLVDAIAELWDRNYQPNARLYSSKVARLLAKFKNANGDALQPPAALAPVRELVTNQLAGVAIVGDFTQLLVGVMTSFRLETSRSSGDMFSRLGVEVRAYLRADVALAHPAFAVLTGPDVF